MNEYTSVISQVVNSILPVFIIIFIGWFSVKKRIVGESAKEVCATLVSGYVFPALLFTQTAKAQPEQLFNGTWAMAFFVGMFSLWLMSFLLNFFMLRHDVKQSGMLAMLCSFPNMGGMGIPFLTLLIGASSVLAVAVANVIVALSVIPLTIFLLELGDALRTGNRAGLGAAVRAVKKALAKPLFLGVVAGMLVSSFHLTSVLPAFIFHTVDIVSGACNFVSLFAVGVAIYGVKIHLDKTFCLNVFLKCMIAPMVAWSVALLFHITGVQAEEMIFLLAMPTATTATILAYQWRTEEKAASSLYMTSTAMSVITLPLLLILMKIYIPGVGV